MTPQSNYFELFGLPESFDIDPARLASAYQTLQTEFHPDRYASADAATRRASVEQAALINAAYQTLKDPLRRGFYLLELAGHPVTAEHHTIKDGAFLMKQMEYRERLDEVEESDDPLAAVDRLRDDLAVEESALTEAFKSAWAQRDFESALDHLTKWQFFGRIKSQLEETEAALEDRLL